MSSRLVPLRFLLPPLVLALLGLFLFGMAPQSTPRGDMSGFVWMPIDEFGRNALGTLASAMLFSLVKGLVITAVVTLLAAFAGCLAIRGDSRWFRSGLRTACTVVESVPLVLWVVIVVVTVRGPRLWITLAAFGSMALPSVTQIFLGELTRLWTAPSIESARLLGVTERRLFGTYLLPAALPVLVPVLVQVLGSAIAIDGAIGVFGLGSRSDIDLGVFLLRGKEQFVTHPAILVSALLAYGALYLYLQWLARSIRSAGSHAERVTG